MNGDATQPAAHGRILDSLPAVVRGLLDPSAYPVPHPTTVELRQTHISYVLLAGERVYKIKKPVALGFLDYSTPARRAYYCRREVELNRRLAPEVYLGVVPIVERGGAVRVGGRGRVLERAVLMRRLPEAGMLTHLLATGAATVGLMVSLAERLAAFHSQAASGPRVARFGRLAAVRHTIEDNLRRAGAYVGLTLDVDVYAGLQAWTAAFCAANARLLRHRARSGRIRDGHGDLHAASICVVDAASLHAAPETPIRPPISDDTGRGAEPVLFDCIDFNRQLRCTDVAAEVAFLAMDLDRHGRADLAHVFVGAYVRASADRDLQTLLPLYQGYRATVRGLVASLAADAVRFDATARAGQLATARAYFDLAYYAYAGGAPRPVLLILGGLPGTGKSTLAAALAGRLALVPINSDVVRKAGAGLEPTTRGGAPFGAELYAPAVTEATYAALFAAARYWLERGVSVALDASFRRATHRAAARALAETLGVPWLAVECVCPPAVVRRRLGARAGDPAAVSDADWAIYQRLRAEWTPWGDVSAVRYCRVNTRDGPDAPVASVLAALRAVRGAGPAAVTDVARCRSHARTGRARNDSPS